MRGCVKAGVTPAEYWEMDQAEVKAVFEGYAEKMEDQLTQYAMLACWIVNSIPIPMVKNRQAINPRQLMGKSEPIPTFQSADELKSFMKKKG